MKTIIIILLSASLSVPLLADSAKITKNKAAFAPLNLDTRAGVMTSLNGIDQIKNSGTTKNIKSIKAPSKIVQKPTDVPKDRPLEVRGDDGYFYCYSPTFIGEESYVSFDACSRTTAARYDVFKRLSFKVENTYLCISAPRSVLDGPIAWDYIRLRPCAINDEAQFFVFKDGGFYTKRGNYRIKEYGSYLYISKNPHDSGDHSLTKNMETWLRTIAPPVTMAIKSQLYWFYDDFGTKVSMKQKSSTAPLFYYYNIESKQLFTFNQVEGENSCLASNSDITHTWDWTSYETCNDYDNNPRYKWDILFNGDRGLSFFDHNQKILRTPRYGVDWGYTYTADRDFISSDITNSPTSYFIFDDYMRKYFEFYNGNIAQNLDYCPAIGRIDIIPPNSKLPSDFSFDINWLKSLYSISTSDTEAGAHSRGICGACFLQAMEMAYQLAFAYPNTPNPSGHFFHYERGVDPFLDLHTRHSILHDTLVDIERWYAYPLYAGESQIRRLARTTMASLQSTMSNFEFIQSPIYETTEGIHSAIRGLLAAPRGSIFIIASTRTDSRGVSHAHALTSVVTSQGLVVLQTNAYDHTFDQYRAELIPTRDFDMALRLLSALSTINGMVLYEMTPSNPYGQPLDLSISQRDCSGGGANNRGSNSALRSSLINQCLSGRCDLPH